MFKTINKWFSGDEKTPDLPERPNRFDVDPITMAHMGLRMNSITCHYDIHYDIVYIHCMYNDMPQNYPKGSLPFCRVYERITGNVYNDNLLMIERDKKIKKIMNKIKHR